MRLPHSNKICLSIFSLTIISFQAQAQQKEETIGITGITSINSGLLGISFSKEYFTGKISTVNFEFGFWTGSARFGRGSEWLWGLPLRALVEPRVYYNLGRRTARKKNVSIRSSDFVSLATSYSFHVSRDNLFANDFVDFIAIIPHWGFRRMVKADRFYFEPSIGYGIGYVFSPNSVEGWTDMISLNIKFGCLLGTSPSTWRFPSTLK